MKLLGLSMDGTILSFMRDDSDDNSAVIADERLARLRNINRQLRMGKQREEEKITAKK